MEIPSPCIDVCRLSPETGWCQGCLRTVEEIRAWPRADNGVRQAILERTVARRAAAGGPAGARA
ncbi:DUF1289 domain-containing protein [Thauera chlorobenzoica]|uniref:DUF1289 domain-containing protein n=1 Tax=Thauera chlorobenzoica TaxID=96773 RepID=UPI0009FD012D|nr:DUF1289 domain-containing protein [Thauera chlorobenzoica]